MSGQPSEICGICRRILNQPDDPSTKDCGGDCLRCMAEAGDPDAILEIESIIGNGVTFTGVPLSPRPAADPALRTENQT